MGSSNVVEAINVAVEANVPTILWDKPGTGKTSFAYELAKGLDRHMEAVAPSLRDPTDFSGLPMMGEAGVILAAPAWARRLLEAPRGLLVIDEASTASPAVQAAFLRVCFEGIVGEQPTFFPQTSIIATANPPAEAAAGWDLAPPLANRFFHIQWSSDYDTWIEGMLNGWPVRSFKRVPEGWEAEYLPEATMLVTSFIRVKPHYLHQMPKDDTNRGGAWPSHRTWSMAARLLGAGKALSAAQDTRVLLLAGCVGEGTAMEFFAWEHNLDLPDPEELLKKPEKYKVPERGDQIFSVATSIVQAVKRKTTKERWANAWKIIGVTAKAGHADIMALPGKMLLGIKKADYPLPLADLKEFEPMFRAMKIL